MGQQVVFERVGVVILDWQQAGFERQADRFQAAVICGDGEQAPDQLDQGVVGGRLAAVDEEGDAVGP